MISLVLNFIMYRFWLVNINMDDIQCSLFIVFTIVAMFLELLVYGILYDKKF